MTHLVGQMKDALRGTLTASQQRIAQRQWDVAVAPTPEAIAAWDSSEAGQRILSVGAPLKLLDVWYIDDGHTRADLIDGDLWLAAFDVCGAGLGICRSETKSLFACAADDIPTPPYTAGMCRRREHGAIVKYLGVEIGNQNLQFAAKVDAMAHLQTRIRELDDPAIELLLTQQCADVGKVMHLLRAVGPDFGVGGALRPEDLEKLDSVTEAGISSIVRMEAQAEAVQQASWSVKLGGLGLRQGTMLAFPAHIASLIEAKPYVEWLAREMTLRQLAIARDIGPVVEAATASLLAAASEGDLRTKLRDAINEAAEAASTRAAATLGTEEPAPAADRPPERDKPPDPGGGPSGGGGGRGNRLQHSLVAAIEEQQAMQVISGLRGSRAEPDVIRCLRLCDLGSSNTKHGWLSAVNPAHGPVLSADQFIIALRLRLGIPVVEYEGAEKCAECGVRLDDQSVGNHALLCGRGKMVIGHNWVRDHLANLARISDGETSIEATCASALEHSAQRQRPGDILTSATSIGGGVGKAAIDIGIVCPFSQDARASHAKDPLDIYRDKKLRLSDDKAKAAGWTFHPMILSCYGRCHDDAIRIVRRLAQAAARRYGVDTASKIEAAWWSHCSTLIAARAASLVTKCLPALDLPLGLGGIDEADVANVVLRNRREIDVADVVATGRREDE